MTSQASRDSTRMSCHSIRMSYSVTPLCTIYISIYVCGMAFFGQCDFTDGDDDDDESVESRDACGVIGNAF